MRKSHVLVAFTFVFAISSIPAGAEFSLRWANRETLTKLMASLSSHARLVEALVPTVACPQDGQVGPQDPPLLPKNVRVIVPEGMATSLAFYSAYEGVEAGVLAPRGWNCFGLDGSSGTTLYVVPHWAGRQILGAFDKLKDGPAVIRSFANGDTSGRYEVAKMSARVFPRARAFVETVRDPNIGEQDDYVFTPWPADRLNYLADFTVSYVTPASAQGLGTAIGFAPTREPIYGLVVLLGGPHYGPHLEELAVRLARSDQRLYAAIAVAKIAPMGSLISAKDGPGLSQSTTALGAVTAFYYALGQGDGFAAAEAVIPEKRARGPLSSEAMTKFYSQLAQPLSLDSVSQLDARTVFARYHYRTMTGQICDGEAQVTVRPAGLEFLIERVRALKNC